ncbi:N-acetylglucosamine-6-phosphate deacetylase [Asticcacaulis sp. 201]|uniref:N-acetylglucosamine-6-phosphate deacetylase n=1 Tax=Asticcacaulis sp. 201 TaxID=3028787 RepID=UPI002915EA1F|nr:N-acetylglucosamine-6-phosphate deacetylase [Asticcacaulis sp. 201]MDV6330897.1 N-acetylglucosamine-6-phosphate deacetylase [Asticcacaulis sp. 201]
MTKSLCFTNGHVLTPHGREHALYVNEGQIASYVAAPATETIDLEDGFLVPGFLDTQVNGGGGVLFNDSPDVQTIAAIGDAHAQFGTTGFLPTLISDRPAVIDRAMRAVEAAIAAGVAGVLGIHIEGPFIAEARKGIHDPAMFRKLDAETKALLGSLKHGRTLVTLAPETCTPEDIADLTAMGVTVAAGHTDASYENVRAALGAGLTGFTHLYNAMSPLQHRSPGAVGAALEDEASYCGLIMDGYHLHPAAARVALRCKGPQRLMLVTDAMPTVGADTDRFLLGDKLITAVDGKCVDNNGTLAGSALDMISAVRNAMRDLRIGLEDAVFMAASAPAAFMGVSDITGSLKPGLRADMVWLNREFSVRGVWRNGSRYGLEGSLRAA